MAAGSKKSLLADMAFGGKSKKDAPDAVDVEELDAPDSQAGGEEEEDSEGLSAAADEVFDAVKGDDREAFASALKSFVKLC